MVVQFILFEITYVKLMYLFCNYKNARILVKYYPYGLQVDVVYRRVDATWCQFTS